MKILLIGSGGREHAMAWKLASSSGVEKVMVAPGNPGMKTEKKLEILGHGPKTKDDLLNMAKELEADLVVFGPEAPLAEGFADHLRKNDINALGPGESAALLEASKIFSKNLMKEFNIPTASFEVYSNYDDALEGLKKWEIEEKGIVIKADGLAGGKGVVVTHNRSEAETTLYDFMKNPDVSVKTSEILFEAKLHGKELSAFALCHGEDYLFMGTACDYKRVGEGDTGANTGGMGTYTPQTWPSSGCIETIKRDVIEPTLKGMVTRGTPFQGILFVGLMIAGETPSVVEYNVRFGDPETQVILPLLKGDLAQAFNACAKGELSKLPSSFLEMSSEYAVHVVMASGGYPSIDKTPMTLNQEVEIGGQDDDLTKVFYAGVKEENGKIVNSGGRVLGVTAISKNLEQARELAYKRIDQIHFQGAHYRGDIAKI
jgi:phosphoribosylamine---glycine ligase